MPQTSLFQIGESVSPNVKASTLPCGSSCAVVLVLGYTMKKYCIVFKQLLRSKSSCEGKKEKKEIRMNHNLRFKYTFCYLRDMLY